jgi:hypothetical protein
MHSMDTAPRDRPIAVYANRLPFDDATFITKAHYDEVLGWVVKDEPLYGFPSMGLFRINAISWMPL